MSKVLTKILITRAADTNQQLLFKHNFTHSRTVFFLLFYCPSIKVQKIGLFLAKTGPTLLLLVDSLAPTTVLAKKKKYQNTKARCFGDQLDTEGRAGLKSVRFKTRHRHSTSWRNIHCFIELSWWVPVRRNGTFTGATCHLPYTFTSAVRNHCGIPPTCITFLVGKAF
jgi:hypothetical protein